MSSCDNCPSKGTCGKDEESCGIVNNSQNKIKNIKRIDNTIWINLSF